MQVTLLASEGLLPAAVVSTTGGPVARMAIDFSKLPGPFAVLRQTIASTGIRGLWLGHSGTLLRETGGSSAWFSAFEVVSRAFMRAKEKKLGLQRGEVTKADLRAWELCVSGGAAGMAYNRERAVPRPSRSVSRSVELTRCSLSLSLLLQLLSSQQTPSNPLCRPVPNCGPISLAAFHSFKSPARSLLHVASGASTPGAFITPPRPREKKRRCALTRERVYLEQMRHHRREGRSE